MVKENIESFLNEKCEKGLLYEEDVNEIKKMYRDFKKYNYEDIFDKDKEYLFTGHSRNRVVGKRSLCNNKNMYTTGVLEPIGNKIYKVIVVNQNVKFKEILCIDFLREIYFQKLAKKYIINKTVIIPEIYNYGYINKEDNIIYFFEMDYYNHEIEENININKDLQKFINQVEINNNKLNIVLNMLLIYYKGVEYLEYIEKEYNIYHNDYINNDIIFMNKSQLINMIKTQYKIKDRKFEYRMEHLYQNIKYINNIIINKTICVIIDFGRGYRNKIDSTSVIKEQDIYHWLSNSTD
jgi:hypothetical protein